MPRHPVAPPAIPGLKLAHDRALRRGDPHGRGGEDIAPVRGMKVPLMPLARRKRAARGADLRVLDEHFADLVSVLAGLDGVGELERGRMCWCG